MTKIAECVTKKQRNAVVTAKRLTIVAKIIRNKTGKLTKLFAPKRQMRRKRISSTPTCEFSQTEVSQLWKKLKRFLNKSWLEAQKRVGSKCPRNLKVFQNLKSGSKSQFLTHKMLD